MRLGLSSTTAGSCLSTWPIRITETTRSETRLSTALPPGSGLGVATHPVAQLSFRIFPSANSLQLTHRSHPPRTHTFHTIYDANGNLTVDATGKQFFYDAENLQKEVKDDQNNTIGEYIYDGDGRRVKKIVGSEVTIFVYNAGGQLVAEYSTQIETANAQVSYLTTDHLGSSRIITGEHGAVSSRKDFAPFGEETVTEQRISALGYNPPKARQDFTGYEKDEESGLQFAQARYFNPNHGRFTSVDPLLTSASPNNPQTWNRFAYALNNPFSFVDPTGMKAEWVQTEEGVFFDSRVVDQASATAIYGEGAKYRPNGDKYVSSSGTNVELGDLGFYKENGELKTNGDRAEATVNLSGGYSGSVFSGGLMIAGAMTADDVTGVGIANDPAIPVVIGATIAAALAIKATEEIVNILRKPSGPQGVQYALRATASAEYPCYSCPSGTKNLNQNDVWKYGETIIQGRYSGPELTRIGVRQVNEFYGSQVEIKVAEKVKIYAYFATHGHLPPGNKIFR